MNKREKLLAILTGALVATVLLKAVVVTPLLERWKASVSEEQDLGAAITRARSLAGRLDGLVLERAELASSLRRADGDGQGPVPQFVETMGELAKRAGFKPQAVRDVRREEAGPFKQYVFSLRATTDLASLTRFLAELEASDAYIRVTSLSLVPAGSGGVSAEADDLNADLILVALAEDGPAPSSAPLSRAAPDPQAIEATEVAQRRLP